MRRREFITFAGGAASWPLVVLAQQSERIRHIGILMAFSESDPEAQSWAAGFREELGKLGWTEGRNVQFDTHWATADVESLRRSAKQLVALQPDLILTGSTPATAAMRQQTNTHRFRDGRRSCRQRIRREPIAAGRQSYGFHSD